MMSSRISWYEGRKLSLILIPTASYILASDDHVIQYLLLVALVSQFCILRSFVDDIPHQNPIFVKVNRFKFEEGRLDVAKFREMVSEAGVIPRER